MRNALAVDSFLLQLRAACAARGIHALSQLALLEQIRPGLMAGDLAEILRMPRSSIDRALEALEFLNLIERAKDGSGADRRMRPLVRTPDGEALLAKIRALRGT